MLVRYISSHNAWVGLNHPIRMGLMDDLRGCQWIVKTRGDFSFLAYSRFCKHFIPFLNFAIRHNFPAFFIIASPQGGERENNRTIGQQHQSCVVGINVNLEKQM